MVTTAQKIDSRLKKTQLEIINQSFTLFFSIKERNRIFLTVAGSKFDHLGLTTTPAAENRLSIATKMYDIVYIRYVNFNKCGKSCSCCYKNDNDFD